MAEAGERKGSKAKGRKIGRCLKSASHKRYVAENRRDKNARIKQARHESRVEADETKVRRVARGTARASRRM